MDLKAEPDPRFKQFTDILDGEGKAIGFTIPGCEFKFIFDEDGGWEDETGNYFNHDGVLIPSEDDAASDEDEIEVDDDSIDEIEKLLEQEQLGIIKKTEKTQPKPAQKESKEAQFDYQSLIQNYNKKQNLREDLPPALFIYFKIKTKYYEEIHYKIENKQSIQEKNKAINEIKQDAAKKRQLLIQENPWLNQNGVFLDFSGDSDQASYYDRYWYGSIKTNPSEYIGLINKIIDNQAFKLLQIKTFYALKSKFFSKKSSQKMRKIINESKQLVSTMKDEQVISIKFDGLPEAYPLSFIYDLIDFVGGSYSDIESAVIIDDFSAELKVLKNTALKIANLQGYNHDKGEFIQLTFEKNFEPRQTKQNRFYFLKVDSEFKMHERQLHDTLALGISRNECAKHFAKDEKSNNNVRLAVGSVQALKKVLMFRGVSLNVTAVYPSA